MRRCEPESWVLTPRVRHGEGLDSGSPFCWLLQVQLLLLTYLMEPGARGTMGIEEREGMS
jgi:hypothetical protein